MNVYVCSMCDVRGEHRSPQKAVGQGWRICRTRLLSNDYASLWFCPEHTRLIKELDQTVEISLETLKQDIVESVRRRVLRSGR